MRLLWMRMKGFAPVSLLVGLACLSPCSIPGAAGEEIPYGHPSQSWDEQLGNHRAVIRMDSKADAVWVHIPWRRRDSSPEKKAVLICNATTGKQLDNVLCVKIDREIGDLVFQPDRGSDTYYVYYMPLAPRPEGFVLARKASYLEPESTADPAWVRRNRLGENELARGRWRNLPKARVIQIQARTEFDSFYPMEVIATQAEVQDLLAKHPGQPFLLFAEDRDHPVKMSDHLPLRWVKSGPKQKLVGKVYRNEFYVFQVGVYAPEGVLRKETPITVKFSELRGPDGAVIPAGALKCFNLGGVDDAGRPFQKKWAVSPGNVGALWFGVQVPLDARPSRYEGEFRLCPEGHAEMPVNLILEVQERDFLRDGGVDQPERLARLKWLDSRIGLGDGITAPYTPLRVNGATIACLGRQVRLGKMGFPESIQAGDNELLAEPIGIRVLHGDAPLSWIGTGSRILSMSLGRVTWESASRANGLELRVGGTMEFDGGMGFDVSLTAKQSISVSDIALEIPFRKATVPYVAGMGLDGGDRAPRWEWKWSQQPQRWRDEGSNLEYFIWLGNVKAGLYCRLKSPLDDWKNGTKGGVRFEENPAGRVVFRAFSGPRMVRKGEELRFSFRLLPTPLKPFDRSRWNTRYAHVYRPLEEIKKSRATVVNVHHATLPNLFINYPFLNLDLLVPYVREVHRMGLKVKLYYTVRELTNHIPELWALRSLGTEIYRVHGVGGHGRSYLDTWLQEHVVRDYAPAWITRVPTGEIDASLRTHFDSRWNNFYLEGLRWLLENVEIDGLYLDEVGYSRHMMQRVRRVLDKARPGSMIDLHSNREWWSCNSPVGYYMEHLPYIDRLWFGEAFDPDSPPDFWLIEMSGIPLGLPGDMLQDPNPWRGMIYGMTARAFYQNQDTSAIWKLWDEFGIEDSEMIGYWEPDCPVRTDQTNVLATVYRRKNKSLVAIASWAREAARTRLEFDWRALGLNAARARLLAPSITGFQEQATFQPSEPIPVDPGRGWLLIVQEVAGKN